MWMRAGDGGQNDLYADQALSDQGCVGCIKSLRYIHIYKYTEILQSKLGDPC